MREALNRGLIALRGGGERITEEQSESRKQSNKAVPPLRGSLPTDAPIRRRGRRKAVAKRENPVGWCPSVPFHVGTWTLHGQAQCGVRTGAPSHTRVLVGGPCSDGHRPPLERRSGICSRDGQPTGGVASPTWEGTTRARSLVGVGTCRAVIAPRQRALLLCRCRHGGVSSGREAVASRLERRPRGRREELPPAHHDFGDDGVGGEHPRVAELRD